MFYSKRLLIAHAGDKNHNKRFHFPPWRFVNSINKLRSERKCNNNLWKKNEFRLIQLFWNLHKTLLDSSKAKYLE
jgi:hypothetical protein